MIVPALRMEEDIYRRRLSRYCRPIHLGLKVLPADLGMYAHLGQPAVPVLLPSVRVEPHQPGKGDLSVGAIHFDYEICADPADLVTRTIAPVNVNEDVNRVRSASDRLALQDASAHAHVERYVLHVVLDRRLDDVDVGIDHEVSRALHSRGICPITELAVDPDAAHCRDLLSDRTEQRGHQQRHSNQRYEKHLPATELRFG